MPAMAIDGAEITSRVLAERPRLFSAAEAVRSALNLGADLLLPPVCISCRKRAGAHGLLCGDCWARIDFIVPPLCSRLGVPLPYDAGEPSLSAGAIADPPVYDRARAAARYSSTMRDPIQSFKYGDRHEGVPMFGRWMAAAGAELLAGADVILPVPLYRSRLWSRRFNQSAMLAQEVGNLTGVAVDCFLLARVKRTPSQVGLTAAQERGRGVPGDGGQGGVAGEAHRRGGRRDHHRCHRRGLRQGAETGRCGSGRYPRTRQGRGTFGHAAIGWNLRGHTLTYRNKTRPNGRRSGTSMTRVVLYATPYCGYCRAAKHLLGKKGVTFTEIDVSEDVERRREMIGRAFGRRTVPQIFINDTHIGGYDELAQLERAGKLDALLAEVAPVSALAAVPGE